MSGRARRRRGIVTGAASGIGRAVVRRMLAEEVDVVAVDIDAGRLDAERSERCETLALDVTDVDARRTLAEAAEDADYLVNSAGILKVKPIFDVTVEDWRAVQTVNAEAVFFLCQQIGPRLRAGGAIVNLSSSSAKLSTSIQVAPYAASKTTILSITRSFAYALAPRPVRVNAICPGIIDTPMQENFLAGAAEMQGSDPRTLDEARKKNVPLGRGATAEECAGAIWFLLSDEAGYMTGQAVNFTGGLVTW